jgi:hypothetical protein
VRHDNSPPDRQAIIGSGKWAFRPPHANYFSDRPIAGAASAAKIVLELTAYRVRAPVETGTGEADQRLLRTGYRP